MIVRMSPLPSALLSKFYERDSLRNTDTGFELRFKNRLAPTTIIGIGPLTLDGLVYEADNLVFAIERAVEGHRRPTDVVFRAANDIKDDRSRFFEINAVLRVAVPGSELAPGSHQVTLTFRTKEVGDITVSAEDVVATS